MFEEHEIKSISKIARHLDVPLAALLAVVEVESNGKSHATVNNRAEPLIRFEGHYFDRLLNKNEREEARRQGLASPIPGQVKNPRSQKKRWVMLQRAIAINRIAALSSCSWGVGQVMGAHWKWLGYGSVDALVTEARSGLNGQVKLMARYIERAELSDTLRKKDWPKFARVYNGPAYAKNKYDQKMADAYSRYSQYENQLTLPSTSGEPDDHLRFGMRGGDVVELQKRLSKLGYLLVPDGFFGLITDRVVKQFQQDHRLPPSGIVAVKERRIIFGSDTMVSMMPVGFPVREGMQGPGMLSRKLSDLVARSIHKIRVRLLSISNRFA